MLKMINQWLFPHICCLCDYESKTDHDLCAICKASLPWIVDRCSRCGLWLESNVDSVYCQQCRLKPPAFDRLCALFTYEPPITRLVTGLKFNARLVYGRVLGELLREAVGTSWYKNGSLPEAILPVPLHRSRLRKRGFNQALELLAPLQKQFDIPVLVKSCVRVRKTPYQAQLNKAKRKRNMESVFQVKAPLLFEHIAIMDDVVTTGSTVNALAKVLKEAGVMTVDVWCICRA